MIAPELLQILCCPETHQRLRAADPKLVQALNVQITNGQLKNRTGKAVTEKIDSALLREDGKVAYVVRRDIPVMLIDEAVPVDAG